MRPPAGSLLARRRAVHKHAGLNSQSQQNVLCQPDLVQRFVEYLPFDQLISIKAVARPFRTAARRALTRGRWRPLRFLDEHGESATREALGNHLYMTPGAVLPSTEDVDLLHEAWAIAPGEVLRIILDWQRGDYTTQNNYIASVFLRYVEPGTRYQRDMDELRKSPPRTTRLLSSAEDAPICPGLLSFLARPDGGFARVVAAFESCNSKLIDLPLRHAARLKMVGLLGEWLTRAHNDDFGSISDGFLGANIHRLASPEWLGNELALWANPIEAAKFVISGPFVFPMDVRIVVPWHYESVPWNVNTLRRLITSGWKDRRAASAFDRYLFDWTRTAEGRARIVPDHVLDLNASTFGHDPYR